jgi:surface-anchored protein
VTLSFDAPGTYEVVMTATALIAGTDVTCESDPFNMLVLAP